MANNPSGWGDKMRVASNFQGMTAKNGKECVNLDSADQLPSWYSESVSDYNGGL